MQGGKNSQGNLSGAFQKQHLGPLVIHVIVNNFSVLHRKTLNILHNLRYKSLWSYYITTEPVPLCTISEQ